ncbi:hypothetical protein B0I35DRAFT_417649 [Stachybotrys elegans]|uniref:Secreted protein n=1 Tax=Stachybotrys elegans TaxID=80388 RepID=A0A8K0T279_9HYPO|nr:hypothetical protein B0I35DRAFT_417649 [Stachybotrys elegans]
MMASPITHRGAPNLTLLLIFLFLFLLFSFGLHRPRGSMDRSCLCASRDAVRWGCFTGAARRQRREPVLVLSHHIG